MGMTTRSCVLVSCDECGDRCWDRDGYGYEPHWSTEDVALADLVTQGWRTTASGRLLCARCAAVLACRTQGHQFRSWQPCYCDQLDGYPMLSGHHTSTEGSCTAQWRSCERCDHHEERLAPEVPSGPGGAR
jgi:hypothetical protein